MTAIVALGDYFRDRDIAATSTGCDLSQGSRITVWTIQMPPDPSITESEFSFLARRAGLKLSATQLAEMYRVYGYIEQMAENVRRPRAIDAESALIFTAEKK